ncbi:MAG: imidazole glycerol phosphate synthase subunit HisH [Acidimicrobiia bacterium]|nr:imidazole glycerol phosphate synthase subunit HisH [Acidimicrobiia bacterium]MYC57189.1 imidazole glycerol phosphate synthase subunit HisH [Acidimicrobiia bacterium]MYG93884.1 imidazole glycerol phosphate synthase subunit HisH [Acidimicrobiia bacterium]MYI29887.1 imidazole glycerol phosphate synthase subunit HisH [Acidimicrobiia bacterium]
MRSRSKAAVSHPQKACCEWIVPVNRPLIAVLDYGIGNLYSAQKSLQRMGGDARLTADPKLIADAAGVVLPGVGAFRPCMQALKRSGLDELAHSVIGDDRPFLGICIGLQLLYEGSEEAPDTAGLGILSGTIELLRGNVKRPQMQWNRLDCGVIATSGDTPSDAGIHPLLQGLDGAWVYFVHSYAAPMAANVVAVCDYGGPVAAVVAENNVCATQFHPEKSARSGLRLLANFVRQAQAAVT